ncbi:MAG: biotin--[acetyl-CoA-carboxylase] ligase [Calditrichaceae bacterium]
MLDADRIKTNLTTGIVGENFIFLEETESTNKYALKLAKEGAPEGTVVCAGFQTGGKGRFDRHWFANPGENMLLSIIVRPEMLIDTVQKITLASAVILIEAIQSFLKSRKISIPDISVKWPNDLLVQGKKLAGILAESILRDKKVETLVIGFGLNINTTFAKMPVEIRDIATSIAENSKKTIQIEDFVSHFLNLFEKRYLELERTNYNNVVSEWKRHCDQFGQKIKIKTPDGTTECTFHDINENGLLIYRLHNDELKTLHSGEILKV